ncbi:MAG: hypothetical protein HYY05_00460 [Chloroflexi bacterium]|nr:hypothetical protein [Chloroflexota bacterium]
MADGTIAAGNDSLEGLKIQKLENTRLKNLVEGLAEIDARRLQHECARLASSLRRGLPYHPGAHSILRDGTTSPASPLDEEEDEDEALGEDVRLLLANARGRLSQQYVSPVERARGIQEAERELEEARSLLPEAASNEEMQAADAQVRAAAEGALQEMIEAAGGGETRLAEASSLAEALSICAESIETAQAGLEIAPRDQRLSAALALLEQARERLLGAGQTLELATALAQTNAEGELARAAELLDQLLCQTPVASEAIQLLDRVRNRYLDRADEAAAGHQVKAARLWLSRAGDPVFGALPATKRAGLVLRKVDAARRRSRRRRLVVAASLVAGLTAGGLTALLLPASRADCVADATYGRNVCDEAEASFRSFWQQHRFVLGAPVTESMMQNGRRVQVFESALLEFNAEAPEGSRLQLRPINYRDDPSLEKYQQFFAPQEQKEDDASADDTQFHPTTSHYLGNRYHFRTAWEAMGGREIFGEPLSDEFVYLETGRPRQYFERAIMEYYDDAQRPFVRLVPVGLKYAQARGWAS